MKKTDKPRDLCGEKKPLTQVTVKVFGEKGWQEDIVMACSECIKYENINLYQKIENHSKEQAA